MMGVTTHSDEHNKREHTSDSAGTRNEVYHGSYDTISSEQKFACIRYVLQGSASQDRPTGGNRFECVVIISPL